MNIQSVYWVDESTKGLGLFSDWGGGAISTFGNISNNLIGGIYGNKIAKVNSQSLSFQEQTKRDLSKDNLVIAQLNADVQKQKQLADLERSKILASSNQMSMLLQKQKEDAEKESRQYSMKLAAGIAAVVVIGGVILFSRKKRK